MTSRISPTFPPKKILVATDGSVNARRAEEVATNLAKEFGAELLIISVVTLPAYFYSVSPLAAYPVDLKDTIQSAQNETRKLVSSAEERAKSQGVTTESKVLDGISSVISGIIDYAENEKIDLIVIGTRGLGGFKKLLMGSVSSGVVTHAHCNVMVVK